jgi:hypothetical protein
MVAPEPAATAQSETPPAPAEERNTAP